MEALPRPPMSVQHEAGAQSARGGGPEPSRAGAGHREACGSTWLQGTWPHPYAQRAGLQFTPLKHKSQ